MADAPRGPFIRRKPIRQIEEIFMQRGPDGELLFRPSEKITIDLPDQYVIAERKPMLLCVHSHLIRAEAELGGICETCNRYLCFRCRQVCICAVCEHSTCLECGTIRGDGIICPREGFWRLFSHSITGRHETTNNPTRTGTAPSAPVEPRPQWRLR